MTFAGYNAGPGNVRKWVARLGDPRSSSVDPIDWIESIPLTETRKYVQKVMQNVHVYRTRFAPQTMHSMSIDLARGSDSIMPAAAAAAGAAPCGRKAKSITALIQGC